jgi:biofilm PGA synthesis N-glycosyltransferase PgaC
VVAGVNAVQTKYVVITPVRDEEAHLRSTVECMQAQTVRACEWIIVDDGSTDRTGEIINASAKRHSWIRGVHRSNRGFRKAGGGVVEAFNDGLAALSGREWDFIVKLDGDLTFEPDYFQRCFAHFEDDPQLGVGGGVICYEENGSKRFEQGPAFHVRGATKIYRRKCWEAIGGFWPAPGWDCIDEVKANMLGWRSRSFPELHLIHHRLTGSADGHWGGAVKNGRANYISGYHPLFMLAKCLRRIARPKTAFGGVAMMYGFVTGYLMQLPRVDDPQMIAYLRQQQIYKLLGRQTIWQ